MLHMIIQGIALDEFECLGNNGSTVTDNAEIGDARGRELDQTLKVNISAHNWNLEIIIFASISLDSSIVLLFSIQCFIVDIGL